MCCELLKIIYFLSDGEEERSCSLADRIKRELDDNLCDDLCLDAVCAKLNYSKNHIISVFSRKFGKTPAAYIRGQRTEIAKDYLANTSMSVGEIAEAWELPTDSIFRHFSKKRREYLHAHLGKIPRNKRAEKASRGAFSRIFAYFFDGLQGQCRGIYCSFAALAENAFL